jgi:hypothetical protein
MLFIILESNVCFAQLDSKRSEWGSGHAILLIFMDYPSKNRRFQPLNRYFQGQNHYYKESVFHEDDMTLPTLLPADPLPEIPSFAFMSSIKLLLPTAIL